MRTIEARQGLKFACPEEIAFEKGWCSVYDLQRMASNNSNYGSFLSRRAKDILETS